MSNDRKRILITGATGNVGLEVVRALHERGEVQGRAGHAIRAVCGRLPGGAAGRGGYIENCPPQVDLTTSWQMKIATDTGGPNGTCLAFLLYQNKSLIQRGKAVLRALFGGSILRLGGFLALHSN